MVQTSLIFSSFVVAKARSKLQVIFTFLCETESILCIHISKNQLFRSCPRQKRLSHVYQREAGQAQFEIEEYLG